MDDDDVVSSAMSKPIAKIPPTTNIHTGTDADRKYVTIIMIVIMIVIKRNIDSILPLSGQCFVLSI